MSAYTFTSHWTSKIKNKKSYNAENNNWHFTDVIENYWKVFMEPKNILTYLWISKLYRNVNAWNSWLHCQITKRIKISKTLQSWNPNTRKAKLDPTSFIDYKTSPKLPSCDSKRQPKYSWNPKLHDQVTKWNSNLYSNILLMVTQIQTSSSKFPSCTPKQHNQSTHEIPKLHEQVTNGIQT